MLISLLANFWSNSQNFQKKQQKYNNKKNQIFYKKTMIFCDFFVFKKCFFEKITICFQLKFYIIYIFLRKNNPKIFNISVTKFLITIENLKGFISFSFLLLYERFLYIFFFYSRFFCNFSFFIEKFDKMEKTMIFFFFFDISFFNYLFL